MILLSGNRGTSAPRSRRRPPAEAQVLARLHAAGIAQDSRAETSVIDRSGDDRASYCAVVRLRVAGPSAGCRRAQNVTRAAGTPTTRRSNDSSAVGSSLQRSAGPGQNRSSFVTATSPELSRRDVTVSTPGPWVLDRSPTVACRCICLSTPMGGSCDEGSHLARRNRRSRGYRPGSPVGGADGRHHRGAVDQHLSDLHLYEIAWRLHESGRCPRLRTERIVREVGSALTNLAVNDRVVIPFQISCGSCDMCEQQLSTQCETTQVRDQAIGAALFGYSELYGQVPGGQAELLRVPQAQITHMKVPEGPPVVWPMPDRARRRSSSR